MQGLRWHALPLTMPVSRRAPPSRPGARLMASKALAGRSSSPARPLIPWDSVGFTSRPFPATSAFSTTDELKTACEFSDLTYAGRRKLTSAQPRRRMVACDGDRRLDSTQQRRRKTASAEEVANPQSKHSPSLKEAPGHPTRTATSQMRMWCPCSGRWSSETMGHVHLRLTMGASGYSAVHS